VGGLKKNFVRPFGPQSGLKIRGGGAEPSDPSPGSLTLQHRIYPKQQLRPRDVVTLSLTTI